MDACIDVSHLAGFFTRSQVGIELVGSLALGGGEFEGLRHLSQFNACFVRNDQVRHTTIDLGDVCLDVEHIHPHRTHVPESGRGNGADPALTHDFGDALLVAVDIEERITRSN